MEKEEVQTTYEKFNREAMTLLHKNIDKEIRWGEEFGRSIRKLQNTKQATVMNVPNIKKGSGEIPRSVCGPPEKRYWGTSQSTDAHIQEKR